MPIRHRIVGRRLWTDGLVAVLLLAAACTGYIGSGGPGTGLGGGGGGPGTTGPGDASARPGTTGPGDASAMPGAFAPGAGSLRRLTKTQYWNSVDDLFPFVPGAPRAELDPDLTDGGFASVGASAISTSPTGVAQYESAALQIAGWAFGDAGRRSSLVGCQPAAPLDPLCARSFLGRFGRLAFRRPLNDAEVNRYMMLFMTGSDFWSGMQTMVAGLLQSPKFLYRDELGAPAAGNPSVNQVQSYQMASRLSFLIWASGPDAALLDAAGQSDPLSTTDSISSQVARMLASPKARTGIREFFYESLNLQDMSVLGDATLAADLHEETLRLVDDLVFTRNAPWEEFFTSTTTFINQNLAGYYGYPPPAGGGFVPFQLPAGSPRQGFFGQGAFLVATSTPNHESPTLRGKSVREDFLCQHVPPPPPGVNTTFPTSPSGAPMTTRQLLEQHRANPVCATCHKFMDAIGVAFESFDFQGKYRDRDNGLPIDASGDLDGQTFTDARALSSLVAARPETATCLVRKMYRAAVGHVEGSGEEPAIAALDGQFGAAGHKIPSLVKALVTSDAFRQVSVSP